MRSARTLSGLQLSLEFAARGYAWLLLVALMFSGCSAQPSLREAAAVLPARVELEHVPFFPQEEYQCGPAALATVLNAVGVQVSPQELAGKVYLPARRGSLQTELVAAVRSFGHLAYVMPPRIDALLAEVAAGRPVLVLQNLRLRSWPAWHFAVVIGYDTIVDRLILRSGTNKRLELSSQAFAKTWQRAENWALIALRANQLPAQPQAERYLRAAADLEQIGQHQAARTAYERAREQWPESPWPWLGLANLSYAAGDLDGAQEGYLAALARSPQHAAARHNLAEVLAARGCISEAREEAARALIAARSTPLESTIAATLQRVQQMPTQSDCK